MKASAIHSEEIRIADAVRQFRRDQGRSLRELAGAAGMSESYLSRVENHKASLTIPWLRRLADALGVSMACFFQEDRRAVPVCVCRAGEGRKGRLPGRHGMRHEMLAAGKGGKLMEPLIADIASAQRPPPLKGHPGEEFDYVLQGECLFIYGKEHIHLKEGDAVYYDATVPHTARAITGRPCRMLVAVTSRDYLFHGDLGRLLNEEGT